MHVVVRPSVPALAPFVSSIGYLEGRFAHARERALPTGGAQLLINLDADVFHSYRLDGSAQVTHGAAVQTASSLPTVIDPAEQRSVLWVAFHPGGGYPFFRAPSDELVALDEFWGRDGAVLRERLLAEPTPLARIRLLERVLVERAARPLEPDPAVRFAAAALRRGDPVAQVSDALGWTPRRLLRSFADQVGLAPKRYARVGRFQRLLASLKGDVDWARSAVEHGFHDQAHLIHEFRAFSGLSPTGYRPRSGSELNHVPISTIPPA
jgi:AraC-like DNA-binding protein